MTEAAPANLVRVAIGICLAALGILLLLVQLGSISSEQVVRLWPLALVIIGGAMAWQAMRGGPTPRGDVSVGGIIWLLILGAALSTGIERRQATTVQPGYVNAFAMMSGDRRVVTDADVRGSHVTAIMGGAELDLRQAPVPPGNDIVVDVFTMMGGTVLRVPPAWKVDLETEAIMGGVKDDRRRPVTADPGATLAPVPRVIVRGTVLMGGLSIK
jgi:hypothetical protein